MNSTTAYSLLILLLMTGCNQTESKNPDAAADNPIKLITLDPGHFHAALVQKTMIAGVDSVVNVYAPGGPELDAHLALIDQYRSRTDNPATWKESVYTGADFLDRMLAEKKGNLVVLAGNNRRKTEYIGQSIEAGINVLADKPMAIDGKDFELLKQAFSEAEGKKVLLYDIMTERFEITNILQRALVHTPEIFGDIKKGTTADPAVRMESIHYFFKQVSGKPLVRPEWFFDPEQQGEPLADVGTHLIDLVQWQIFPDSVINYNKDIQINNSRIWPTPLTLSQYSAVTGKPLFASFLKKFVRADSILDSHANGEVDYTLKGIHVKVTARWDFQAKEGGDAHRSIIRGSKATIDIRQGKEEAFQPTLYIFPASTNSNYESELKTAFAKLQSKYAGLELQRYKNGWRVVIPENYKTGHEAHFGEVMQRCLGYLKNKNMPAWEVPNMLAKYYVSTRAVEMQSNTTKQ